MRVIEHKFLHQGSDVTQSCGITEQVKVSTPLITNTVLHLTESITEDTSLTNVSNERFEQTTNKMRGNFHIPRLRTDTARGKTVQII